MRTQEAIAAYLAGDQAVPGRRSARRTAGPAPGALKAARQARGHSQQAAARAMGVSLGAVHDWEQGRRRQPRGLNRQRLERYIGATGVGRA